MAEFLGTPIRFLHYIIRARPFSIGGASEKVNVLDING
jgi:hypothetical protein